MTEQAVQLIITLKVKENDVSIERPINIMNLEKDICALGQEIGTQVISMMLAVLDDRLRDIVPDNWKNAGTEERGVLFECGNVRFKRRVYQDENGRRHKPLDDLLGLEPYQRSSPALEEMSCALGGTTTYRKASELLSWLVKTAISPSTVGRYLKKIGLKIQEQEQQSADEGPGGIHAETLYAESDGVYINLQREKQKRIEVKVGLVYTGKVAIGVNRYRCKNKVTLTQIGGSSEQWQLRWRELIYRYFDYDHLKLLVVGGDGAKWVRNSYNYVGLPIVDLLDRFHVVRAVKQAWGSELDIDKLLEDLFTDGWYAIRPQLIKSTAHSKGTKRKKKLEVYKYLLKHRHALVDLDKRGLAIKNFCTLGAAEGNVDKLVRQRMRGRGCCWSIAGATAMLAILPHINALSEHVFEYHSTTKKEPCRNNIKETQGTGYRPVSGSLSFLKQRKNSEMWVELLKANLNSNLLLNEFF